MLRVLLIVGGLALSVYALLDCLRTEENRIQGLPKAAWGLVVLIPYLGPIAWFLTGRNRRGPHRPEPRRPAAPDDDPDFLRDLDIDINRPDKDIKRHDKDEA